MSWARLLKRVIELDLEHCPNCGGALKIIAAIVKAPVIEKILTYLGLQAPCAAAGSCAWTGTASGLSTVNFIAVARPSLGRGDRLGPGLSGPGQSGLIARVNT